MKSIPVDCTGLTFLIGGAIEAATTPDDTPRTDRNGQVLFNVPVVVIAEAASADTLTVRIPGPVGQLSPLVQITFQGLVARPWSFDGRSGVSFAAAKLHPVQKP